MIVEGWAKCFLLVLSISSSFKRTAIIFIHPITDARALQSANATLATTAFLCSGSFVIQRYSVEIGSVVIALGVLLSLAIDRSRKGSPLGPIVAVLSLAFFLALTKFP